MSTKETVQEKEGQGLLENFNWDGEESFFGIEAETEKEVEEEVEVVEEVKKVPDAKEKEAKKPDVKKEEDEEDTPFKDESKVQKVEVEEEEDEDDQFFTQLAKEMKEKGVFQIDLPDEPINEEKFFELHEVEIESRVDEVVEGFIEEMDDDGKAFLKFKRAGGKTEDFFRLYSETSEVPVVDINTESGQDEVLKYYYKVVEGLETDDIADKLDWMQESGKKRKYAEKYYQKLKEDDQERKAVLLEQQNELKTKVENQKKEFATELRKVVDKTEKVGAFAFTKEDRKEIVDYITKPAVKIGKNKYITQLQSDIGNIFQNKDREKLLLFAKLIKNDFDTKDLVVKAATQATKIVKSNLKAAKSGKPASSTTSRGRTLADYFG